jgi:anti-anti-sigma factor
MKILDYSKDRITVISPEGRIDSESSPVLEKRVLAMLQRGDRHLVLDMSSVGFMASSGLRTLLVIAKKCQSTEAHFVLAGVPDLIRELLDMTGFLRYVEIFSSADAAISAMTA